MYAADGISGSVTSNCSAVTAARARLCWKCMLSAHRVCVLWNSSYIINAFNIITVPESRRWTFFTIEPTSCAYSRYSYAPAYNERCHIKKLLKANLRWHSILHICHQLQIPLDRSHYLLNTLSYLHVAALWIERQLADLVSNQLIDTWNSNFIAPLLYIAIG